MISILFDFTFMSLSLPSRTIWAALLLTFPQALLFADFTKITSHILWSVKAVADMFLRLTNIALMRAPPYEEGYTYVQRLATGKLCFVRKRTRSNKPKPKKCIEVCEERPQYGSSATSHHAHRHDSTHGHIICHDRGPSDESCATVNVYTEGPIHIYGHTGETTKTCQPQGPIWETREPKVKNGFWFERKGVPVRVVRVGKSQEERICVSPSQPKARCETSGSDRVWCSKQGDYSNGVEEDKAVWDPVLRAWVVKRAPRVQFSGSEAGCP